MRRVTPGSSGDTVEDPLPEAVNGKGNTVEVDRKVTLPSGQVIAKWTKNGIQFSRDILLDQEELEKIVVEYFKKALKN